MYKLKYYEIVEILDELNDTIKYCNMQIEAAAECSKDNINELDQKLTQVKGDVKSLKKNKSKLSAYIGKNFKSSMLKQVFFPTAIVIKDEADEADEAQSRLVFLKPFIEPIQPVRTIHKLRKNSYIGGWGAFWSGMASIPNVAIKLVVHIGLCPITYPIFYFRNLKKFSTFNKIVGGVIAGIFIGALAIALWPIVATGLGALGVLSTGLLAGIHFVGSFLASIGIVKAGITIGAVAISPFSNLMKSFFTKSINLTQVINNAEDLRFERKQIEKNVAQEQMNNSVQTIDKDNNSVQTIDKDITKEESSNTITSITNTITSIAFTLKKELQSTHSHYTKTNSRNQNDSNQLSSKKELQSTHNHYTKTNSRDKNQSKNGYAINPNRLYRNQNDSNQLRSKIEEYVNDNSSKYDRILDRHNKHRSNNFIELYEKAYQWFQVCGNQQVMTTFQQNEAKDIIKEINMTNNHGVFMSIN